MCMYAYISKQACKTRGVVGGCSPRKYLEIRCSEVASGAIFEQSRAVVATILSNFWLSYMHLVSQLTSNSFHERRLLRLAEQ